MTTDKVRNVIIWGNHSSTQFPDVSQAYVENGGKKPVYEAVNDDAWLKGDFIKVSKVATSYMHIESMLKVHVCCTTVLVST